MDILVVLIVLIVGLLIVVWSMGYSEGEGWLVIPVIFISALSISFGVLINRHNMSESVLGASKVDDNYSVQWLDEDLELQSDTVTIEEIHNSELSLDDVFRYVSSNSSKVPECGNKHK
tara:strand:+ start:525 stop:878 length:354 start_codon:yes stop_codon:yes gene_type:complete